MKDGYYWVRDEDTWIITLYNSEFDRFRDPFYGECFTREDITEIGDYIETPNKYKEQSV